MFQIEYYLEYVLVMSKAHIYTSCSECCKSMGDEYIATNRGKDRIPT